MTVAELIGELKKVPQDATVFLWVKNFEGDPEEHPALEVLEHGLFEWRNSNKYPGQTVIIDGRKPW